MRILNLYTLTRTLDNLSNVELEEVCPARCNQEIFYESDEARDLSVDRSLSSLVSDCATIASGATVEKIPMETSSISATSSTYSEQYSDYERIDPDILEPHQQGPVSLQTVLSQLATLTQNSTNDKISISLKTQGLTFNFSNENRLESNTINGTDSDFRNQFRTGRNFRSSIRINLNQGRISDDEAYDEVNDEEASYEEVSVERISDAELSDEEDSGEDVSDKEEENPGVFCRRQHIYHPGKRHLPCGCISLRSVSLHERCRHLDVI